MILEQEIIKLVKLSVIKSVGDMDFSSSWIRIKTNEIGGKYIYNMTEYVS